MLPEGELWNYEAHLTATDALQPSSQVAVYVGEQDVALGNATFADAARRATLKPAPNSNIEAGSGSSII